MADEFLIFLQSNRLRITSKLANRPFGRIFGKEESMPTELQESERF